MNTTSFEKKKTQQKCIQRMRTNVICSKPLVSALANCESSIAFKTVMELNNISASTATRPTSLKQIHLCSAITCNPVFVLKLERRDTKDDNFVRLCEKLRFIRNCADVLWSEIKSGKTKINVGFVILD